MEDPSYRIVGLVQAILPRLKLQLQITLQSLKKKKRLFTHRVVVFSFLFKMEIDIVFPLTRVGSKRSAFPPALWGTAEVQLPKADLARAAAERSSRRRPGRLAARQPGKPAVAPSSLFAFSNSLASGERRAAELCARWRPAPSASAEEV